MKHMRAAYYNTLDEIGFGRVLFNLDVQLDSRTDVFRFAPSQIVGCEGSEALLDDPELIYCSVPY
jgi:hypothetical protein